MPPRPDEIQRALDRFLQAARELENVAAAHGVSIERLEEEVASLRESVDGSAIAQGLRSRSDVFEQRLEQAEKAIEQLLRPTPAEPITNAIVIPPDAAKSLAGTIVGLAKTVGPYAAIATAWLAEHFRWIP